jgi:hypothetical protein
MSSSSGAMSYRRLLRTSREVFLGDDFAVSSARTEIRSHFVANRDVRDTAELAKLHEGVDEAVMFLRHSVMQGRMNERGSVEAKLTPESVEQLRSDPEITVATVEAVEASIEAKKIQPTACGGGGKSVEDLRRERSAEKDKV